MVGLEGEGTRVLMGVVGVDAVLCVQADSPPSPGSCWLIDTHHCNLGLLWRMQVKSFTVPFFCREFVIQCFVTLEFLKLFSQHYSYCLGVRYVKM